jgi:hypothetical protein
MFGKLYVRFKLEDTLVLVCLERFIVVIDVPYTRGRVLRVASS